MKAFHRFPLRHGAFLAGVAAILLNCSTAIAQAPKDFDAAMDKYLQSDKGQAALGKTVEEYFRKRQESSRKEHEDREKIDMEAQFKNPVKLDVGKSPIRGKADAKITVIEFSDFQCPFCKRGADTMEALLKAYPTQVKVAFKNLPLPFHKDATPAAKAALAAGKQGKFWEMHDALFNNQDKLGDELYAAKAKELGLDLTKFKADMASPELDQQIKDDMALGQKNGIQGTPGFFVGGVAVKGAYPIEYFKSIVDRHLKEGSGS